MLAGVGVGASLVLAATACGGGKSATTTTTASGGTEATVQWANGVCSAFSTWKTSLESINVGANPSESALRQAERQIEDATTTLTRSLKDLGKPDTAAGQTAKQSLDTLQTQISNNLNKIQDTLKSTPSSATAALAQISTVSGILATMAHNLTLAFNRLKHADPTGEVDKAFHQAKSCSAFIA